MDLKRKEKMKFFRKPSEVVYELENTLWAVDKQVEKLKKMKSLNNVPEDFKEELQVLFSVMSYKYEWE